MNFPIYNLTLPEYRLDKKPDYNSIGKKIDNIIRKYFPNKWIAIRGIGLQDHAGKSAEEMIDIIKKNGADKYDSKVKSPFFEMDKKFKIDFHATPMFFGNDTRCPHYNKKFGKLKSVFAEILKDFYEGAVIDRGYSVRLDILMVYDLNKLNAAPMKWGQDGPILTKEKILPKDTLCFQFKNKNKKTEALLGFIVLR